MSRLTYETLHGIWAGITLSWDDAFAPDEASLRTNLRRLVSARVHGIYTTGSTGEFYALDHDEFRRLVDILVEEVGPSGIPMQVGCVSDNTRDVLRQLEYVAAKDAIGAAQVAIPYWMELTDREVDEFFRDLYTACPDLPLVHYNVPRAKRFLQGPDYARLLEIAPSLIGVKYTFAGANFTQLQDALLVTPNLSYFVGENLLASTMQLGARGSYSSLIATDPEFMLTMYDHCAAARWTEAIEMQQRLATFLREIEPVLDDLGEGAIDPVFDKGLAVATGFYVGHQRTRKPYLGWSDRTVVLVRSWVQENYPEFIYKGEDADSSLRSE